MVPVKPLAEVVDGEDSEDAEGDDLLDDFELRGREGAGTNAVGWDLQAVLEEGDAPADEDDLPECDIFVLEVSVPSHRHEDVRAGQKKNCPHLLQASECIVFK